MRKLFSFLLGFLLGALVGVALATLLAPSSGMDLRNQIQLRIDQAVEEGKRAKDERTAELYEHLEALKKGKLSAS